MREIDVAGVDAHGKLLVAGLCKWTNARMDFDELNLLERLILQVDDRVDRLKRYLFSRRGFTKRLLDHASSDPGLRLVTPADIYAEG